MAIHYLQCGVSPPIFPSLQNCYPSRFGAHLDVRSLDISCPLEVSRIWDYGRNNMSLGELLEGFFHYYVYDFK
jgi:poly(A) RNA polymerase GLD2